MTVYRSSQPYGYLYDDWEDGKLVARDRTVPPQSSNQPYKLFRPCWAQGNGSPAVGSGHLEFAGDGTSHEAIHTSYQTEGVWELTANYNGGTSGDFSTHLLTDYDLTSRVTLYTNPSGGETDVYARDADGNNSTVVSNTVTDLSSAERSFRVTIDSNKNVELFVDGSSVGTGSYGFESATGLVRISGDGLDSPVQVSEFKMY